MNMNCPKKFFLFVSLFVLTCAVPAHAQLDDMSVIEEELNKYEIQESEDFNEIMIDQIVFTNDDIQTALRMITIKTNVQFEIDSNVKGQISVALKNVSFLDLLRIILQANDLAYMKEADSIRILTAERFEIINGYDFEQDMRSEIFNLKFVDGKLILKTLEQMKSASGKIFYDVQTNRLALLDIPRVLQTMHDRVIQWDVPTQEEVFELTFLPPQDVAAEIGKVLTPNIGKVEVLSDQKAVRVVDTKEKLIDINNLIDGLDRRDRDVEISARIIQIILSEEYEKGVDWEAIVSGYESFVFSGFGRDEGSEVLSVGHVNKEDYHVLLDALDTVGVKRDVLQLKRMVALEEATTITVEGKKIILNEDERAQPKDDYDLYKDIKFNVSAAVTENDIHLKFKPQIFINKNPSIDPSSYANFDITVKQGDTVILGGMYKNVVVTSQRKVPFFGDLPLLGFAFRNEEAKMRKSEVIIFLTPEIVEKVK